MAGAFIGTILLAIFLAGPAGLLLVLIVWIVVVAVRRSRLPRGRKRQGSTHSKTDVEVELAARSRALENSILGASSSESNAEKLE